MLCSDTVYKCAYSPAGKEWKWYDVEEGLPAEDDDPDAKPKSCSDNYDNDCNCGDQKCKKKESKSMFKSGSFWGGAGVGLVAGYVLAGTPLGTVVSLASTGASFLTDDPETKAALSGFGLGLSIGNYVGSSTKYGNAGGDKWKDGVGDKAAEKDRWWLAGSGQPNSVGTSSNAWTRWMSASPDMGFAGKFGSALSGPTANMAAGGIAAFATYKASDNYKEKVFKWKKNETCASTNY
jgi:hypothetical protein